MPVKIEPTPPLPGLSRVGGKPLVAGVDGGRLCSDGGVLALREIERHLGIADRMAAFLKDPRVREAVRHSVADIIRFRLLMIAAGYEAGNDADLRKGNRGTNDDSPPWGPVRVIDLCTRNRRADARAAEPGRGNCD